MRLLPGSAHSTAFCLAFHQGNKPLRDNPVCTGQVTLLIAGCSPLSWSKPVFRQSTYNLALCEPSSLRREAFREMNEYNPSDKAPCSFKSASALMCTTEFSARSTEEMKVKSERSNNG